VTGAGLVTQNRKSFCDVSPQAPNNISPEKQVRKSSLRISLSTLESFRNKVAVRNPCPDPWGLVKQSNKFGGVLKWLLSTSLRCALDHLHQIGLLRLRGQLELIIAIPA
jgi:hypothetical protein